MQEFMRNFSADVSHVPISLPLREILFGVLYSVSMCHCGLASLREFIKRRPNVMKL